jgi:hypothetical protein
VYGQFNSQSNAIGLVAMYYASDYPADKRVLDHQMKPQMGVQAANLYPACLDTTLTPPRADLPSCDADFLKNGKLLWRITALDPAEKARYADNVELWKLRGAIATGMAVFSYMRQRVTDPSRSRLAPYYDQCELLP